MVVFVYASICVMCALTSVCASLCFRTCTSIREVGVVVGGVGKVEKKKGQGIS